MDAQLFLNNLWRWKCGLPEKEIIVRGSINYESLKKTEWDYGFENLMRNRLILGSIRYGKINAKNKPKYDMVLSIKNRLKKYEATGNKEYLVDIANLCLLEFVECFHPNKHFNSIDDGEHVNIK